jgi:hypothetical protein
LSGTLGDIGRPRDLAEIQGAPVMPKGFEDQEGFFDRHVVKGIARRVLLALFCRPFSVDYLINHHHSLSVSR